MTPVTILGALTAEGALRVEIRADSGPVGIGEARPQGGVTGESAASALTFVQRMQHDWQQGIDGLPALRRWIAEHERAIDWNPAAWTAVELAFLDFLARRENLCLEDLLGLRRARPMPRGTACIGETTPQQFDGQLTWFICAGFQDYRISLTGNLQVDRTRVEALEAGRIPGTRVRAAAHGQWLDAGQATDYLSQLDFPWWAVEEPLAPGALREMRRLGERMNLRIVLDESLHRVDELDALAPDASRWVALARIGKMGGLLRALTFARRARVLGIDLILATQPEDPPGVQRALLCLAAQAHGVLAHEGPGGPWEFDGAPARHVPRYTHPAPTDPGDAAGWLRRPGLGIEPVM